MMTTGEGHGRPGGRPDRRDAGSDDSARAFRLAATVTLLDAMLAAGPALPDLLRSDAPQSSGTVPGHPWMVLAMHAAGPRLALAASVVIVVGTRSTAALTTLGATLALSQAMDAVTSAVLGDTPWVVVRIVAAASQVWALALLDLRATAGSDVRRAAGDRG